jgi:hypothetical protein
VGSSPISRSMFSITYGFHSSFDASLMECSPTRRHEKALFFSGFAGQNASGPRWHSGQKHPNIIKPRRLLPSPAVPSKLETSPKEVVTDHWQDSESVGSRCPTHRDCREPA